MSIQTRRGFVAAGIGATLGMRTRQVAGLSSQERPPALPSEQVFEFVRVAHGDLERTREMLTEEPHLLNATWDWGDGDFETALGGASHMGNRDIAGFLLDHGARLDLFCAAAMGMLDVVTAVVDAYPAAVTWAGPHGIPLLRHAVLGEAPEVADFLKSRGAT